MEETKPKRTPSTGKCFLCGKEGTKSALSRHLSHCLSKRAEGECGPGMSRVRLFRIGVEGERLPEYWMQIEARADVTLDDLDSFLRGIWLECCDHLSEFVFPGQREAEKEEFRRMLDSLDSLGALSFVGGEEIEEEDEEAEDEEAEDERESERLDEVLEVGLKFQHLYDFGSTTTLKLKVVSEREGCLPGEEGIRILARNDPPVIPCDVCGNPATRWCMQCRWGGEAALCPRHARKHECGEEMQLAIVNSPRTGVCGYE